MPPQQQQPSSAGYGAAPPAPAIPSLPSNGRPNFPPPPPPMGSIPPAPSINAPPPPLDMYAGGGSVRPSQMGKLASQPGFAIPVGPPPGSASTPPPAADLAAIAAKKRAPPPPPPKRKGTKARALYDYQAQEADELSFSAEDTIWITKKLGESLWWTIVGNDNVLIGNPY